MINKINLNGPSIFEIQVVESILEQLDIKYNVKDKDSSLTYTFESDNMEGYKFIYETKYKELKRFYKSLINSSINKELDDIINNKEE
jgi:hypothetical protein